MHRSSLLSLIATAASSVLLMANATNAALVDRWSLNEAAGTAVNSDGSLATPMRILNLDEGSGGNVKWVSTPGGSGLQFNGAGGTVVADISAGFSDQDYGSTFAAQSLEAWIKIDADGLTGYRTILAKNGDLPGIYLILLNGQPGQYPGPYGSALSADQWYHIVHTADATTERVYVNGVEVATASSDWTPEKDHIADPGRYLNIGTANYGTEPFKGVIDEIRIHDNVLSAEDVLTSYQNGPAVPEPAMVGLLGAMSATIVRRRS